MSRTPSDKERLAEAKAVASATKLAAQRRASGGQHEDGAPSFASPFLDGGEAATKRLRRADTPELSADTGVPGGTGASAAVAAPISSSSSSVDDFIFKHSDDLVAKLMDGRNVQGKLPAILQLLELLEHAGWPKGQQPDRNLCLAYLLQLRGVATVSWSDSDKKFSVSDYIPSALNEEPSWAAPGAPLEVASESGDAKADDAKSGDAASGDLNDGGGASSSTPALS